MDKSSLVQIIEKYYLNGLVEKASLSIKDKVIDIKVVSQNKDLVAFVTSPGFEIEDCELGVYDTSQLLKLVNITDSFLTIDILKKHHIAKTLLISDNVYDLEFALADTMMIPSTPKIEEPDYEVLVNLDVDFLNKFIKSKKALDTKIFSVESSVDATGVNTLKFILGAQEKHTNKVIFSVVAETIGTPGELLLFPIEEFKEILDANKDMESGSLRISEQGLMRVEFKVGEVLSSYLLVAKEEA